MLYITLDGIGIFDENVSLLDAWNKDINKYNTFIPRIDAKETQFNVSLDELYPNISSLDESDRDIWNEIFFDSEKRYTGPHAGYTIKLPFYELIFQNDLLKEGGLLVLEHGKDNNFEDNPHFIERRVYGSVNFSLFR